MLTQQRRRCHARRHVTCRMRHVAAGWRHVTDVVGSRGGSCHLGVGLLLALQHVVVRHLQLLLVLLLQLQLLLDVQLLLDGSRILESSGSWWQRHVLLVEQVLLLLMVLLVVAIHSSRFGLKLHESCAENDRKHCWTSYNNCRSAQ